MRPVAHRVVVWGDVDLSDGASGAGAGAWQVEPSKRIPFKARMYVSRQPGAEGESGAVLKGAALAM